MVIAWTSDHLETTHGSVISIFFFTVVIIIYGCLLYSVVYPLISRFDLFDHEEGVREFFFLMLVIFTSSTWCSNQKTLQWTLMYDDSYSLWGIHTVALLHYVTSNFKLRTRSPKSLVLWDVMRDGTTFGQLLQLPTLSSPLQSSLFWTLWTWQLQSFTNTLVHMCSLCDITSQRQESSSTLLCVPHISQDLAWVFTA